VTFPRLGKFSPRQATNSCRPTAQCGYDWQLHSFRAPDGASQSGPDIFLLKIEIARKNLLIRVYPDAIQPTIVHTITRIPQMQGLPPMTCEFQVILGQDFDVLQRSGNGFIVARRLCIEMSGINSMPDALD